MLSSAETQGLMHGNSIAPRKLPAIAAAKSLHRHLSKQADVAAVAKVRVCAAKDRKPASSKHEPADFRPYATCVTAATLQGLALRQVPFWVSARDRECKQGLDGS